MSPMPKKLRWTLLASAPIALLAAAALLWGPGQERGADTVDTAWVSDDTASFEARMDRLEGMIEELERRAAEDTGSEE